ncbi:ras-related protein Rab-32A-like [Actinia tenebrosa]|uniref:Ras-related protein Rab-32A-like n=1 Tax=Actinia tenebrosa TaxID=6105 RepID=A0A6P8HE80_ACTTE|nr:ras-related protein Rab-32A-like [Actinia tenebrosa]
MAYSCSYETPEPENTQLVSKLGKEVELKTFKTNATDQRPEMDVPRSIHKRLCILCVGDWTGGKSKQIYVDHYMGNKGGTDLPIIGAEFRLYEKKVTLPVLSTRQQRTIFVMLGERERHSRMMRTYLKIGPPVGTVVFWGPTMPSSLDGAVKWKEAVQENLPSAKDDHFPFVLLTDNTCSVQWLGENKIFKDKQAMDSFCEQNGFLTWFEMLESSERLGEDNVFGRAVDSIVNIEKSFI